ncbi:predicted protein [Naegleria gruberi]|uniref:Predicted protein n=1 Tax=Naegleria gruberi TaxID=5762 RepID=D2VJC0_NAEGR|nr:uncharacterized protein NAEGRDRAFT_50018 [Naegleria gruberi]EFC43011.1 predicted protein [Naegleria gruberi]|eukprot:XP_002675755.1 predicted protein [Naegleria gruberi strain NEG-M]
MSSKDYIEEEAELDDEEVAEQPTRDDDEDSEEEEENEDLDKFEKDGFIVDDDEEDDNVPPPYIDPFDQGEQTLKRKANPSKKKRKFKRLKKGDLLSKEVDDLREPEHFDDDDDGDESDFIDRDDDDVDIFGSGDEDDMYDDMYPEEDDYERKVTLKDIYGPDLLVEKFLTDEDERIRNEDVPERILLRQGIRQIEQEELYNEACWIYTQVFQSEAELSIDKYSGLEGDRYNSLKNLFVETIIKVLRFILQLRYDIPYIAQYKKEDFEHILYKDSFGNDRDLWKIFEWDEKWCILQSKKSKLKLLYDNAKSVIPTEYLAYFEGSETLDEINDYHLHFTTVLNEESENQLTTLKRPTKRDLYTMAKKEGLAILASQMSLSSYQYAENLESTFQIVETQDHALDPASAAEVFKTRTFESIESVLGGARHICAFQIAHEPKIRQLVRRCFENNSTIKVKLTKKGKSVEGSDIISLLEDGRTMFTKFRDEWAAHVRYAHDNKESFLKLLKYENLGLIKVSLFLEDRHFDGLLKADVLYLSQKHSQIATLWNEQRIKIIEEAKGILNKTIQHSVKTILRNKAADFVSDLCESNLTKMLFEESPYGNNPRAKFDYDEFFEDEKPRPTKYKILSCVPGGEEGEKTTWVMLDENGTMIDKKVWPIGHPHTTGNTSDSDRQLIDSMVKSVNDMIASHQPSVVALAACGGLIFKKMKEAFERTKQGGTIFNINYEIVPDDIARIYENSSRATNEYPQENNVVRRAISVGRRLRDPLTEICGLFNNEELLCYKFHELQDMVPKEQLVKSLEKSLVRVVNRVGVEINRIVLFPQLQPTLRFLSGLGPRKAELLINKIKQEDSVSDRESINNILNEQRNVALNSIGFLIVRRPPTIAARDSMARAFKVIDATRVHLLSYPLAKKMAEDGLETENLKTEKIHKIFKKPQALDELDLDAYADELEKRNYGKTHITLKDIKEELKYPFKDPRYEFKSINNDDEKVFELVTHETKKSLAPGQQVFATVVTVGERIIFCKLDNGLYGVIALYNRNVSLREGEERYFEIERVEYKQFKVHLVPPKEDIYAPKAESIMDQHRKSAPSKKRFHRQIDHPQFKDFDYSQAVAFLADKGPGELVIRPSSKGYDHLAITFKFSTNLYINYDIEEEKKGKDINSLGSTLKVNGKIFSDLDEVIFYCVESLMEYSNQLMSSSKYFNGNRDELKVHLREEKKKNPSVIPYKIVMSTSKAARFYFFYLPGRHTLQEKSFTVTPDGYYFAGRQFKDTVKLINAFKKLCQSDASNRVQPSHQGGQWE